MSPSLSIIHIKLNTHIPTCILGQVRQKFEMPKFEKGRF